MVRCHLISKQWSSMKLIACWAVKRRWWWAGARLTSKKQYSVMWLGIVIVIIIWDLKNALGGKEREREILNPTWSWGWGGCFMTPQGDEWTLLEGSLFAFILTTNAPRPGKSWGYCLVGDIKHGIEDSMYWITWLGVKAKYSLVKKNLSSKNERKVYITKTHSQLLEKKKLKTTDGDKQGNVREPSCHGSSLVIIILQEQTI